MVYQQAADWVRMVNSVTWTLGSIFLLGALITLNGAMQVKDGEAWRTVVGCGVIVLALFWAVIDCIYARSSRRARDAVEKIERKWGDERQFFTKQRKGWGKAEGFIINVIIYLTMLIPAYLGLVVARPSLTWLPSCVVCFIL